MNLESYRKEQKKDNGENEKLDKLAASLSTLKLSSSKEDMLKMPSDSTRKALHEDWLKSIHKDFYVREALEVVKDIQSER
jgi:carboxyl-terminal processing protease